MGNSNQGDEYEQDMAFAAALYADAIAACTTITGEGHLIQTGGMCLVIAAPIEGGWLWVMDEQGNLPWDREQLSGWRIQVYAAVPGQDNPAPTVELSGTDPRVEALQSLLRTALHHFSRS